MKTVLILAAITALAAAGSIPQAHDFKFKNVDAEFVVRQKKILEFFEDPYQVNPNAEYYKIGKEYDIHANIDNYSDKHAVEEFLKLFKYGFVPKDYVFSIYYDKMREEAIALYKILFYAKDFETFYKTAAFAKVYLHNPQQFFYSFYIAVFKRADTAGIVLPAPYELYPEYFVNSDYIKKIQIIKMQNGIFSPEFGAQYGIYKVDQDYVFYTNYSDSLTYSFDEQKLSYFYEDVGLNSFYYYAQSVLPFWLKSEDMGIYKERRGDTYLFYYKQLLARYYLERLSNGLGEIPKFSWWSPIKSGYSPLISTKFYPFAQRNDYYYANSEMNFEEVQFLDMYEKSFLQYLEKGYFKAYNQEINFHNSKSINFVGNYFESNADLYAKSEVSGYDRSYEMTARQVLGAASEPVGKYGYFPSALDFPQTSLRDPVFYQFYEHVLQYSYLFKKYLKPYTQDVLNFPGVKINEVKFDKLVTFFDYFDFDATNIVYESAEELKSVGQPAYKIRQPRLNHKPFSVFYDVKSDVESEVVFKVFLGPKYDSNGYPISWEEDWSKFFEIDWFVYKLSKGQNKIERSSFDFIFFKDDSMSMHEVYKFLDQGKVPYYMSERFNFIPRRLMLPKGSEGGYPFQFVVFAYPYQGGHQGADPFQQMVYDNKPYGYPFDRPVYDYYFHVPNMYAAEVKIYHEGEVFPYKFLPPYAHYQH